MRIGQTTAISFLAKVAGSIIGFLATLYFARILGAEILGYYGITLSLVSWLKLGGSLGVSNSVMKRISEDRSPSKFFSAGIAIIFCFGVLISLLILLFRDTVNNYVGVDVYLVVIAMTLSGLGISIVSSVLKGENRVHVANLLSPWNTGISSVAQIALVWMGMNLTGMFIGYILGELLIAIIGGFLISLRLTVPRRRHFRSLFEYGKYSWLSGLETQSFRDIDVIVLGLFVNPSLVGVYTVAWSISQFLSLFGRSVRSAMFPEISRLEAAQREEQISNLVHDALSYIGLIAIPGFFGSLVIGDLIMDMYGEEFVQGDLVLSLLILAVLIYTYQQQITGILSSMNRPDLTLRVNLIFVVSNLCLNFALVLWMGWVGASVATVISTVFGLVTAFYMLRGLINFDTPVLEISRQFMAALTMAFLVLGLRHLFSIYEVTSSRILVVVMLAGAGAAIYFSILFLISPRFRAIIARNLPFDKMTF